MKRVIGLAALIGAYGLSSYYLGVTAESQLKDYLAKESSSLAQMGYKVHLQDYDRGIFTSRATLVITDNYSSISATLHSNIVHGPILGAQGIGAVASTNQIELSTTNEEVQYYLSRVDDYLELKSRLGFTGGYTQTLDVSPFARTGAEQQIEFAGAKFTVSGHLKNPGGEIRGNIGELTYNTGAAKIQMKASTLEGTYQPVSAVTSLQNAVFHIPELKITEPNFGQTATFTNARIVSAQTLENNLVDTKVGWHIESIDGQYPLKDFALDVALNQIPLDVMDKAAQLRGNINDAANVEETEAQAEAMLMALTKMLVNQGQINFDFKVNAFGGDGTVNSSIKLVKEPESLEALGANFRNYIQSESTVRLSDKLVQESPLGFLLQLSYANYFDVVDDALVLVANVDQGKVTINGQPLEALQPQSFEPMPHEHDYDEEDHHDHGDDVAHSH